MTNLVAYTFNRAPVSGDFGVEIELEGDVVEFLDRRRGLKNEWAITTDGSLTRGVEFVSNGPVAEKELDKHLRHLYNTIRDSGLSWSVSDRTGTHLHLNMTDLTDVQLINFLVYYYIFEELICDLQEENRRGNHFCFRAVDSIDPIQALEESILQSRPGLLRSDFIRYAALNLCALPKYGSVEFRAIQTADTLKEPVLRVASLFSKLKTEAKKEGLTPSLIVDEFSENWGAQFVNYVFGDLSNEFDGVDNKESKLKRGVRLVQPVAYSVADWDKWEWSKEDRRKRKSLRDL